MRRQKLFMIIVAAIALLILLRRVNVTVGPSVSNGKQWTVYGTMGCGWTRKQLDHMKKNGKPYRFVDCDKEDCPGMEAFPTLVSPNGEKTVGYSEV